jgi:hypothetical protein
MHSETRRPKQDSFDAVPGPLTAKQRETPAMMHSETRRRKRDSPDAIPGPLLTNTGKPLNQNKTKFKHSPPNPQTPPTTMYSATRRLQAHFLFTAAKSP